jgi:catechol 2,3-dioxygenase-like lactoylglutathione lyase family enzyme
MTKAVVPARPLVGTVSLSYERRMSKAKKDEGRRGAARSVGRVRPDEPAAPPAGLGTSPGAADGREAAAALRPAASANTLQITPFMHVRELAPAVAFLEDVLGFETIVRMGEEYAYLEREGAGMRVLARGDAMLFPGDCGRFAYYIDVRDVDLVHSALKAKLEALPKGDVHGPADKPYGQRELIVRAPDGQLLVFGAAIGK